ncbi:PilZ domain-containing protein [Agarilytica rhodophyticola]|uniref:PilZ domain-containing protein n=1 Tax=Agarilytica rhodophyticola TaxID=1737490 RepID=UPI000B346CBB|nr:PilZ domain-containing protein [Agarilytica rhodophyticola]
MRQNERRRYFRINETIGISYQVLEGDNHDIGFQKGNASVLELVSKHDQQIERLLVELADEHPKIVELITVFNQKLERVVNQLVLENQVISRIAHRVKAANISACGIAFENDEQITKGAKLKMELTLFPSEKKIVVNGIIVGCEPISDKKSWYWRIDFYSMGEQAQELLIQHIVQCQSQQLKKMRGN